MDTGKISVLSKMSYIFDAGQKRSLAFLSVVIIVGAFVELLGVGIVLPFITAVLMPEKVLEQDFIRNVYDGLGFRDTDSFIVALGAAIILVYILKNVYVYLMRTLQYSFTYNNQRLLSKRMLACYLNQHYTFHLSHNSAELGRNINEDVSDFFETVLASLQFASEAGVCLALLTFLFIQDVYTTLAVVLLAGIFAAGFRVFMKPGLERAGRRGRTSQGAAKRLGLEALTGIKEIKLLGREDTFIRRYDDEYKNYAVSYRAFKMFSMVPKPVMETICVTGILLIVCAKVMLKEDPAVFIPVLSVFAVAAFRMLPSANRIAEYLSRIIFSKPAINAIYEDLRRIEELERQATESRSSGDISFEREIEIRELCFHYPSSDRQIFESASLVIPKNRSVAFIGPSGQGKTTLADLVLGMLEPQKGGVFVDGVNISGSLRSWQDHIGYIPQSISLLDASIRDNILFGIPAEEADEARLQAAIEQAQLGELIDSLEEGVKTQIGEAGVRLSGGQRQRIGIARALYNNPEVLVLDEATSALDNDTEAAVMEAIDLLAGTKTLIIIAHRLSTIENCDIVYEIDAGRVTRKR